MLMLHSSVFARRVDTDYVKLYDSIAEGRAPYLQQNARKFPSICSSNWDFFSLTEPFTCNIWQHFLTFSMKCIFSRNNSNNFKLGIVSYPNYWKTLPSMSQLKHKCRKDDAILRDVSCCTTCKKLHFTYLFFYQTTRSFALWFYHKLKFLYSMNKHQKRWLVLLQQLNFLTELCEMPPAVQSSILWLVRTTA